MNTVRNVVLLAACFLPFAAADQERIRFLQSRIMAPCCWSEPVSVHRSGQAEEIRAEIERMVNEGKDNEAILNHFVSLHGERVLVEPRGARATWLTIMPFVALAGGGGLLIRYLLRHKMPAQATPAPVPPAAVDADDW